MKLSKYFSLAELTRSQTASRKGISNYPTDEHLDNLVALCRNVLDPLRDLTSGPLTISSGYRSAALNKAVGGSKTSQHCLGQAADIESYLGTVQLAQMICKSDLVFDQLILEFYDASQGIHSGWVHISYNPVRHENRQMVLTAKRVNGRTKYFNGLRF